MQRAPHAIPWPLVLPAALTVGAILLPLGYLIAQLLQADPDEVRKWLLRERTAELLGNTLRLAVGVGIATTLFAVPIAWLTSVTDVPGRRFFTLAGVLPLAIPGYLMAYTLLGLGGFTGAIAALTHWDQVPRLSGYWGALLALSLSNFPYLFLTLRAALRDLDPSLLEMARALGARPAEVYWRVVLPQLRPAYLTGLLLVTLHVIADFGVVSLMRYETFSYALYHALFDRGYSAVIALLLVALAAGVLIAERLLVRDLRLERTGTGTRKHPRAHALGPWRVPAALTLALFLVASVCVPLVTLLYWGTRAEWGPLRADLWLALGNSLKGSLPAALVTCALALPIALLARRHSSRGSTWLERMAYVGYATPPLAFALGWVFVALKVPAWHLYQTLPLLVGAYSLHFLAEALGPIRNALLVASPKLEEAARALGAGRLETLIRVTLPLLRGGLAVSGALVFLSCMKELPLTIVLAPLGFDTLAFNVFDRTAEADFASAAPYALLVLAVSLGFVGILLLQGRAPAAATE